MKRKALKLAALLVIMAFFVSDLTPLSGVVSLPGLFGSVEAKAEETVDYSFLIGNAVVNDGGEINYSNYKNGQRTLSIILKSSAGIVSGTAITWTPSNDNIVAIQSQNDNECSVTLDILSPGYSGLSVSLRTPDGTVMAAVAYCAIHVPLEWSDNETDGNNNILANSSSPYGLIIAQNGEKTDSYTLQMFTKDSADHPDSWHYLRKLRYVNYEFKPGTEANYGSPNFVPSNVAAEDLTTPSTTLTWESSDTSVVEVDSVTGLITAVSAGFARVTVTTNTINERLQTNDSLSFNVLVVPEAKVVGYTEDMLEKFETSVDPTQNEIVIQSNAKYASALDWKLFRGTGAVAKNEITSDFKSHMDISEATGRVILSNMPAGVYHLTAIAVKDSTAAKFLQTYEVTQTQIEYLGITIVIPLNFPTDELILNYYNENVFDSFDLLAGSNMPANTFRFTSTDSTVAAVGSTDGVVEASGLGECRIVISKVSEKAITDIFGTYAVSSGAINYDGNNIYVDVTVVNGVQINSTAATMPLGSNLQLNLTAPSPYEGEIKWKSSNDKVVTVDETGLVTAVGVGDANVTVRIKVGGVTKQARCKIKVISAVNSIVLKSKQDFVEVGDNLTISAEVSPKLNNATLSWSVSDETIATIADASELSMTITGVAEGTVVVSAVNKENAIVATKIIKVIQEIQGLTLSDTEVTLPQTTGYYQLYAYCTPALPDNQKLTWSSSNKKVVTVDDNGKVTLVKPGTAVITCVTENGLTAQCTFTITQGITSLTLDQTALTMYVGDKYRMTYTIKPDNASNVALKWNTLDSKIATVDASGYITAKNTGTTVITAQTTDGTGLFTMCTVTVLRNATGIKLDATSLLLTVGDIYILEATLNPADSTDKITYESSNTKVATVSKKGKVTAKGKGTCVIMAKTEAGISAYVNVEVVQPVTGVSLDVTEATIYTGDELELKATVEPKTASDTGLIWTSDKAKVASVDENGKVKGLSRGTTLIKCTTVDGDFMSYCMVTVLEHVTGLTLNKSEVTIYVGEVLELEAKIEPATAEDPSVTWTSSDAKIASVDKKGKVTGVAGGTTLVKCITTDGEFMKYCIVTVIEPVTTITCQEKAEVAVGKKLKLTAEVSGETATDKNVTWKSSNRKICKVSEKGVITGVKPGTCTVTVTAADGSGVEAECEVTVFRATENIEIDPSMTYIELLVGESKTVLFETDPGDVTYPPEWTSSDTSIAVVNHKGTITGLKAGTTTVLATAPDNPNIKGTVVVKVSNPVYATNITFNVSELIMTAGETQNIIASFAPGNITESYTWTSDNPLVASVDSTGKVYAKKVGTAEITLITKESGKKGTVTVYVVGLSEQSVTLHQYEELLLNLEIDGSAAGKLNIRWGTENQNIAVMSNGHVVAKATGTTNVYAMVNGRKLYCKITVIKNTK